MWDLLRPRGSVVRMGPERRRKGLQGGRGGEDRSSLLSESPGTSVTLACGWARKCWVELSGLCKGRGVLSSLSGERIAERGYGL